MQTEAPTKGMRARQDTTHVFQKRHAFLIGKVNDCASVSLPVERVKAPNAASRLRKDSIALISINPLVEPWGLRHHQKL
jgi:hypothetical protein